MNRFKVRRHVLRCVSCRQGHFARKVVTSKPLQANIVEIGFQCQACHKWNRLYFETPEIAEARNRLAAQALTASQPHLLNLRRSFTALFTSEQSRVKKLLSEQQAQPLASSFVTEEVVA